MRRAKDVTDAELAILEPLWDRGEATIRELREAVYPQGGPSEHATVQKLLERLAAKGFVSKERRRGPHVYRPAVAREELIGQRLESLVEGLCGGSVTPLFSHLVNRRKLSRQQIDELRSLVEDLDGGKGRRSS